MKPSYLVLFLFVISFFDGIGQPQLSPGELRVHIQQKPIPVIVDNKLSVVYEAHITNATSRDLELTAFSVLTLHNKETLLHYNHTVLVSRLQPNNTGTIIHPTHTHILYIEASTNEKQFPAVFHRIRFRATGDSLQYREINHDTLTFSNTQPPVLLSNPVNGGNWTVIYDPAWQRGHRRVVYTVDGLQRIPGRFAIDLMKIDSVQYANGKEDSIRNWYGYAADVLAVADGEVAAVRDDFPESATLSAHPAYKSDQATGNYISLKISANRYVFYEHLKPGSIRVKAGQRIKKGQVIAQLGFTGQTTGPHLHLHVADANSPLGAEGLPFIFERFTLIGCYPDFSKFGKEKFKQVPPQKVRKQMPASNTVVVFD